MTLNQRVPAIVPTLEVQPEHPVGKIADAVLEPFMRLFMGSLSESPRRTHRWNNQRLSVAETLVLDRDMMVVCDDLRHGQLRRLWGLYVVLEPVTHTRAWHPGWVAPGVSGVSQLTAEGPVRILVGADTVSFFGVEATLNRQIALKCVALGCIGDAAYRHIPLF